MDQDDGRELAAEANRHGIVHKVERIGTTGDEFEYKIDFGANLVFKKGSAAGKFIEALISEHNLSEGRSNYIGKAGWVLKR